MKLQRAIEVIKGGGFLMAEHDEKAGAMRYACVPGGQLTTKQAVSLISSLGLKPSADTLFPGTTPQTWRMG